MSTSADSAGLVQVNNTSAGDSAGYERRPASLDDVVIVSALRTAITKARDTAKTGAQIIQAGSKCVKGGCNLAGKARWVQGHSC